MSSAPRRPTTARNAAASADTFGFNDTAANPSPPAIYAVPLDIATGLVMLISRFIPIIAPVAIAGYLALKKPTPFTVGTLRTDTLTFGFVLLGTILLVGALLFLPAAVLGPSRSISARCHLEIEPKTQSLYSHVYIDRPRSVIRRRSIGRGRTSSRGGLVAGRDCLRPICSGRHSSNRSSCCGPTSSGKTR